ncbi:MAG: NUDIX domain-containing protein [Phycisphaerae bacterium]
MSRKSPVEGVVIVVSRAARLLLIRRAEGILAGGAWCFVGGAIEADESQEAAAEREFAEEVGGRIRPLRKIWEYRRPDGRLLLHWWHADLLHDALTPNPAEVAELRWCATSEIRLLSPLLRSTTEFLDSLTDTTSRELGL